MNKNLITFISYLDNEILWCYDEIICALSKVNINTFQAECILSPKIILRDKYYEMRKIIVWKNKVIILPKEFEKNWVIYDKLNEKVEYYNLCLENYRIADAFLIEDNLIFVPFFVNNPIIIFDLIKREIVKKIKFPINDYLKEGYIWNAKVEQGDICFLIRNTFFYGRLNNDNLSLIKIKTLNPLSCADFYMEMGWAIDSTNKYLYLFNKEGRILHIYPIEAGVYYTRVIATDKYIYLLPFNKNGIRVIDANGKLIKIIGEEIIDFVFPETFYLPDYWEYVKVNKYLYFLPLKHTLQFINMETLMNSKENFVYTTVFSENQYQEYYKYIKTLKTNFCFWENSFNATLSKFIELVLNENVTKFKKKSFQSNNIWDSLNSNLTIALYKK